MGKIGILPFRCFIANVLALALSLLEVAAILILLWGFVLNPKVSLILIFSIAWAWVESLASIFSKVFFKLYRSCPI
jgi:hypothetical protein